MAVDNYIQIPIIEGQVVDTYGGNYTWQDVYLESNRNRPGTYSFRSECYGELSGCATTVTAPYLIREYKTYLTPEFIQVNNLPEDIATRIV